MKSVVLKRFIRLFIWIAAVSLLFSACDKTNAPDDAEMPEYGTYLRLGDSFEYKEEANFTGSLQCTVTDARLVSSEEDCPPYEWFQGNEFLMTPPELHQYDSWFTEGGAFDQGCQLILLDVTVENVDARNIPQDEGGSSDDPCSFHANWFFNLVYRGLITDPGSEYTGYQPYIMVGFSECNQYSSRENGYPDDHDSPFLFRLEPGEIKSFTLCYPVHLNDDGSQKDLSLLALEVRNGVKLEDNICIELDLEE